MKTWHKLTDILRGCILESALCRNKKESDMLLKLLNKATYYYSQAVSLKKYRKFEHMPKGINPNNISFILLIGGAQDSIAANKMRNYIFGYSTGLCDRIKGLRYAFYCASNQQPLEHIIFLKNKK